MLKNKFIIIGAIVLVLFSSCGIFHKGCGCPHFGLNKQVSDYACRYIC